METDKGKVSIEDIKPGDRVLSRSEDGSVGYKPVLQVFMTHPTELMHLSYRRESSGSSRTTSNPDGDAEDGESDDLHTIIGTKVHRFWSVTRSEWIEMADLEVGERLLLADSSHAVIIRNELEQADEGTTFTTYNFEVPDWSSYYVTPKGSTEASVWVHNEVFNPCKTDVGVPTVRDDKFNRWFNNLTPNELDEIWKDPSMRNAIESRLRHPGRLHEWHLVSRSPTFKRWGLSAEQIKGMRTLIKDVDFVNPVGRHGRKGSTKAHNEILGIIDSSLDYETFVSRLRNWASYRLKGGVEALPVGLRP